MYYLAFFLNYRPFLAQKLNNLLSYSNLSIFLNYNGKNSVLNTLEDLPKTIGYPSSPMWLIYSSFSKKSPNSSLLSSSLSQGNFSKIDEILSELSEKSTWSIIPWGGNDIRFNSFVFISKDQSLRNLFINISSNSMDLEGIAQIPKTNLLISEYDVLDKFSHLTQVITFHQDENIGKRVWSACDCKKNAPWIITTSFYEDEEDGEPPFLWEEAKASYHLIQNFDFTIYNQRMSLGCQKVGVYQPDDIQSFISMLKLDSTEPDTLIVVPKNTNIELIKNLLSKTQGHPLYETFSYLSYLEDIFKTTNWLYVINSNFVGYGDYTYSLFVARDNVLVRKFNELNIDDNYQLISCY
ncbi:MAG: hypothetical protein F6K45_24695 [Kamptonema sp. SIO1D9]|nr:hypothetical protein [Kamptonema sp. SIO1D9]